MEKVQGDDAQLAAMGHRAELKRNFSMLYVLLYRGHGNAVVADYSRSMLGLAFAILNVRVHGSRGRWWWLTIAVMDSLVYKFITEFALRRVCQCCLG